MIEFGGIGEGEGGKTKRVRRGCVTAERTANGIGRTALIRYSKDRSDCRIVSLYPLTNLKYLITHRIDLRRNCYIVPVDSCAAAAMDRPTLSFVHYCNFLYVPNSNFLGVPARALQRHICMADLRL